MDAQGTQTGNGTVNLCSNGLPNIPALKATYIVYFFVDWCVKQNNTRQQELFMAAPQRHGG
jgi:hypothetical protein